MAKRNMADPTAVSPNRAITYDDLPLATKAAAFRTLGVEASICGAGPSSAAAGEFIGSGVSRMVLVRVG